MFLDLNPHPSFKVTTDAFNFSHQSYGNNTSTWQPLFLLDLFLYFYFIQISSCSSTMCGKDDLFHNWFNLALAPFSKINWLYIWWVYFWTCSCSIDLLGYSYVNSTVLTSVAIFKCYKIFLKSGNKGPSMFFFKKKLTIIENSATVSLTIIKVPHSHMSFMSTTSDRQYNSSITTESSIGLHPSRWG